MKWNLRMTAAQRDIWRPTELLAAFKKVGFEPSLSKVAQLWGKKPISLRLDELDKICAALDCTVAELLQAEPLPTAGTETELKAVGESRPDSSSRPTPRPSRSGGRNSLPPN
jgi:DNA-binding Xre family transcriptional regulator